MAAHQYRSYAQREIGSLRKQLSECSSHLNQGERVAQQNRHEMQLQAENCRSNHIVKRSGDGDLEAVLNTLQEENQSLKKSLDDARSHIFSLQPYVTDMTPERIGTLFDNLMSNVMEWVTKFVSQLQDNRIRVGELVRLARRKPGEFANLRKQIERHDDLGNGSLFPDTDIDIFVAIITRWLDENMFQTVLCGIAPGFVEYITYIEASMQRLEPKRDLYALQSWRAETLNALIASSDYQRTRLFQAERLTGALADIFKPFRKQQDKQEYYKSCLQEIIMPALELHEAMSTSIHHYYLDLNPYATFNTKQELKIRTPDLLEKLSQLKLENILQNRKTLVLAKLQPCPSREEFQQMLVNVATIAPALRMKQVGTGDAIRATIIVRPQHMLVAFGSQEQREKYLNDGEHTLITRVFHALDTPRRGMTLWPF
ncbi:hypothetical protein QBC37DRAFT_285640 [Rhypophila decipiens]|uniref:Uncharacterized protein n=1 Tax=Rhypophila decipiens TaxID=261697 RepID=A0AAN7B7D5_9PEZI|nr:hypothetical protein QBC37DRAFT_285640 [Rhypophila decipiens]